LQKKLQPQLAQTGAKLGIITIGRIPKNRRTGDVIRQGVLDQLQREHRLGGKGESCRHPSACATRRILRPALRQIKPPRDWRRHPTITDHHFNADLAVRLLSNRAAILMGDANRMLPCLSQPVSSTTQLSIGSR